MIILGERIVRIDRVRKVVMIGLTLLVSRLVSVKKKGF